MVCAGGYEMILGSSGSPIRYLLGKLKLSEKVTWNTASN